MRANCFARKMSLAIFGASLVLLVGSLRAEKPGGLPLRDEFDSKFTLDWETVRPDPTHLSLETHPSKLTITTQYGSMQSSQDTAKNLFLIKCPQGVENYVITTTVEGFAPVTHWQQAGMLFYNDDDNFLKLVYDCHSSNDLPLLNMTSESNRQPLAIPSRVSMSKEKFWLRMIKRGNLYQAQASLDGKNFTTYGLQEWGDGSPQRVGLLAKNGPRSGDIEAQFDFFEVRALTKAERKDPVPKLRLAMLGNWTAVTREFSGKAVEMDRPTRVLMTPGMLVLAEGKRMRMSYTVDLTTKPNRISLMSREHGLDQLLNGVFQLDGDKLTLCLNVAVNGDTPDKLETTEGDTRMLLKLEREEAEE